ncbi:adenine DNA glycosylase isoform X1 [Erpetoichthys calabaricus]|uniref:adenine DNA glycosylase isoform X1 n=1 Tax=Erpetoichthys calabaricus TaxID=27687 RepID=UPI0022347735|nr:adenine DNA glycosylase isoform X1 [Erpetoichthys calabaricus]
MSRSKEAAGMALQRKLGNPTKNKEKAKQTNKEEVSSTPSFQESTYHFFHGPVEISSFREKLLLWYDTSKRNLPWRTMAALEQDINKRAYAVWVSEIMLQQTQVATVIDYYNKWMKRWPTLQKLAEATLEEVNEMWAGLGYYSRGKRLHEGAKKVMLSFNGQMPRTAEDLQKELPGVGRYTAGAVASIAMGQATGVVDGNVTRVLCRSRTIGADCTSPVVMEALWRLSNSLVDPSRPGDFNQALMELGATVCTPKAPRCSVCPVRMHCRSFEKVEHQMKTASNRLLGTSRLEVSPVPDIESCDYVGRCPLCLPPEENWENDLGVMNFPRKPVRKQARLERTLTCILEWEENDGEAEYLLVQRPSAGLLAGLWEFPSIVLEGKITEKKEKELLLEQLETLLDGRGNFGEIQYVGEVVHVFSHIHQTYAVYRCSLAETTGLVKKEAEDDVASSRWLTKTAFQKAAVSTAMKKIFQLYQSKESQSPKNCKGKKRKTSTDSEHNMQRSHKLKKNKQSNTGQKQLSILGIFGKSRKCEISSGP